MRISIYQISNTPICPDEWAKPETYEDNSDDFADYIGRTLEGEDRAEYIENFGNITKGVFEKVGDEVFRYKGKEAMREFKQAWCDAIKKAAEELTPENMHENNRLFELEKLMTKTHLNVDSRVNVVDWCGGMAYPFAELMLYADNHLNEGDCIYLGSIVDFHY